jgi:hypothetical protein
VSHAPLANAQHQQGREQVTVKNSACSFEKTISLFIKTKLTKVPVI